MRLKILSLILAAAGFAAGWFLRPLAEPGNQSPGPSSNIRQITGASAPDRPAGSKNETPAAVPSPTASPLQATDAVRKIMQVKSSLRRSAMLRTLIADTPPSEVDHLVQAYLTCMAEGLPTREMGELVYRADGRVKRQAGMDDLPKEPNGIPNWIMKHRLRGWASADPVASLEWVKTLEPGTTRSELTADVMEGLKDADPEKLPSLLPLLPPDARDGIVARLVESAVQDHSLTGMAEWFRSNAATLPDAAKKRALTATIDAFTQNQTPEGLTQTVQFLQQVCAPGDELFASGLKQMVWRSARFSPAGTLDLLDQYLPQNQYLAGMKKDYISQCVKTSSGSSINAVGDWLNAHPASPIYNDVAGAFLTQVKSFDPEGAKAWANAITDPAMREEMLSRLNGGRP